MSTSLAATLSSVVKVAFIYVGIPVLIIGVLGGFFNAVVFLSLRTFRQNSCAFYLTVMSISNIGLLLTGFLYRILINGFVVSWAQTSALHCKLRHFFIQVFSMISFTSICLATIDQYFATCSRPRWQRWSNLKLARILSVAFAFIWILEGTVYAVFVDIVDSTRPGVFICSTANLIFLQYHSYFNVPILFGLLPLSITVLFGCLAYYNVRQLNYRTVPLVRQELDKQLTVMVLLHVFLNSLNVLPQVITDILYLNPTIMSNPVTAIKVQFANTFTTLSYYFYFASPFYIYICASERFRRQLIYVLIKIHLYRWQQPRRIANQVTPDS